MKNKSFWLALLAVVISFIGGFFLANAHNKREIESLQTEIGRLKKAAENSQANNPEATLTDEEIRQKIGEADKNPENIDFQKSLAVALYRYAGMKQEPKWLPEVARLLTRVFDKNPRDYNTLVSLGGINLDIAQNLPEADLTNPENDPNKYLERSRGFYQKALEMKPDDTEVRSALGATYLYANPPEATRAIAEFQRALQVNPKDETALVNIVRAFIAAGKTNEAGEFLEKLKATSASNQAIPELEIQLAQSKNKTQ